MTMVIYDKQQKGLISEDRSDAELPILGDGVINNMTNDTGTTWVDNTFNLYNNPYRANNPYQDLADDDNNNDNDGNDDIENYGKSSTNCCCQNNHRHQ